MARYVAFLRAINVGGHVVKMERLRELFEDAGHTRVSTVIASGNVIFSARAQPSGAMERRLERTLANALGYEVRTFVRSEKEVGALESRIPFTSQQLLKPDTGLFVGFLSGPLAPAAAARLRALGTPHDDLVARGAEIFWLCGARFSDSTVTGAAVEKAIGVATTIRKITTVQRIAALVASGSANS